MTILKRPINLVSGGLANFCVQALGETNPEAKESCLADSTTCAAAMANVISGTESLEVKRKIAARNLRAMKRLSRWVVYNRRKWTDLTQRFPQLFIYFSPGPKESQSSPNAPPVEPPARVRWQQRIILSGTIEQKNMLVENSSGGLMPIGKCVDNLSTQEVECELTPYPELPPGTPPLTNIKFTVKMISGHYNHIHLGLDGK